MSLINQMLQELDARGNQATLGGVLQGQVRAVPQRRDWHPGWWIALVLAVLLLAGGAWLWIGRAAPIASPRPVATPALPSMSELSLKIDRGLDAQREPVPLPPQPAVEAAAAVPSQPSAQGDAVLPSPSVPAKSASDTETQPAIPVAAQAVGKSAAPAVSVATVSAPAAPVFPAAPVALAVAKTATLTTEGQQKAVRAKQPEPETDSVAAKDMPPAKPVSATSATLHPVTANEAPVIAKQVKELGPRQLAENEFRKASALISQGRAAEAIAALEQALQLDKTHAEARQTLAGLLIPARRQDEAVRVLREGLQLDASQTGLAMILARLQLERGELKPAIDTLQRSLPHAGERADYVAFLAALLQRDGRHKEAVDFYAQALRKSPGNAVWWMGLGISLQAESRIPEAIEAYKRAKAANGLSPELKAFVEDRLNSL